MATVEERLAKMREDAGRSKNIRERLDQMRSDAAQQTSARYNDPLMDLAMESVQPRYADPLTEMAREEAKRASGVFRVAPGTPGGGGRGGYNGAEAELAELNRLRNERNEGSSAYASGDPNEAMAQWERQQQIDRQISELESTLKARGMDTGRKSVGDFIGDALDVFQANSATPMSSMDKLDYWLSAKLGLIDPADQNQYDRAHALEQDIAITTEQAKAGYGELGQKAMGTFAAAGNVLGSTAFGYATGIPQAASAVLGPVASGLAGTEAGLGATGAQRATAAASRFAGNAIADAIGSPTNVIISAQSGINTYDRAKTEGASDKDAFAAGLGSAALEYFSNKMFSGTPLIDSPEEKGYVVELIEDAAKRIGATDAVRAFFNNGFANFVFDKSGEGLEEVITRVFDPLIERMTFNKDADLATASDLIEEYTGGVALSLLLGIGEPVTNFQSRRNQTLASETGANIGQSFAEAVAEGLSQPADPLMRLAQETAAEDTGAEPNAAQPAAEQAEMRTGDDGVRYVLRQAQDILRSGDMTPDGVTALVDGYTDTTDAGAYISAMTRAYQAGARGAEIGSVTEPGLTKAQVKAAFDAGKAAMPQNHIDNRNMADVGKTNVNAFSFDHPQLHSYFVDAAKILKDDLANSSENRGWMYSSRRGDDGKKIGRYYHQQTSTLLEEAKRQGYSLPEINDALDRIINNHGQENIAVAKRVELLLDKMMTDGYTTSYGEEIAPNSEYIQAKGQFPGGMTEADYRIREYDRQYELADALEAPDEAELTRREAEREEIRRQYAQKEQAEETPTTEEKPAEAQKKPAVRANNPGFVQDAVSDRAKLTYTQKRALDTIGKVLGVRVRMVESIDTTDADGNVQKSRAQGYYDNGEIVLAVDADDPYLTTAVHESVHRIRELSGSDYAYLAGFVQRNMSEGNYGLASTIKSMDGYTAEEIPEEIVADAFGRILGNEQAMRQFVAENSTAAQRIMDVFAEIFDRIKRALSGGNVKTLTENQRKVYEDLAGRMDVMMKYYQDTIDAAKASGGPTQNNSKQKFSLRSVPPTEPTSNQWKRGATYDEVKAAHPTLYELSSEEQDTRNPTQISGTVKTYRKIYDALQAEGFDGTILDASSGLGVGTQAGRDEYGFDVDDIEPFPDKSYTPKYTDYSKLNKQYDVVISNAVLNVLPQDLRDAMVVKIGELMAPGGRAFINVRGDDVKNAKSKIAIDEDGMEYFIADGASYQKGFKKPELKAYLEDVLGDGYTVDPNGGFGGVSVVVRKDGDAQRSGPKFSMKSPREETDRFIALHNVEGARFSRSDRDITEAVMAKRDADYAAAVERGDTETAQRMADEAAKAAGYDIKVYRGGGQKHNVFDTKRGAGDTQFGPGTYFTDAYGLAQDWAKERAHTIDDNGYVGEYYIKAQNLFSDDSTDFNTEQWENVERALRDRGVSERELKRIRRWGFYGIAQALQSVGEIEEGSFTPFSWRNAPKVNQILREAGYDGIEAPFYDSRQYVIFDPTQVKSADPVTYDDNGNIIPLSERFNPENEDIRYSTSDRELLDEYIKAHGAIKTGENPTRDITMPKRTTPKTKMSMTVRTVAEAGATPDEFIPTIENLAANHEFDYTPYSDKKAIADADRAAATKGWQTALTDWVKDVSRGEVSKKNTALGWALYNNAVNAGDTETALLVLRNIVQHQRNAAQAVQATRILKQLNPETQLYNADRTVESLNDELKKKYGDKAPDLDIDPDLAERFLKAKTPEARDKAMQDIYRDIGRQMPTTFLDRWNAWRYLAMLGNPRTHIRNVVGNAGFAPVVAAKNLTATAIESAVSVISGGKIDRTKGNVIGRGDLLKAAWNDYENVRSEALGEGKYSESMAAKKEIEEGRRIFGNTKSKAWNKTGGAVLEAARKANTAALDAEDVWFSKPHYTLALAQYCAANGITAEQIASGEGLAKAREYAIREAQKATYRDTNDFSQAISRLGRGAQWSNNKVTRAISTVFEGILPFRKTPANILARGVEYSPLGLMKSLTYDLAQVKKGNMTAADMIDNLSAGLTGTGLLALGAYLAAQGLLRGRGGDDDKKKSFADLTGHQDYALELPDGTSITLDWLAPEALPMFVGANLAEIAKNRKDGMKLSDILSAIGNVTEPMLEMSCLQSLNNVFEVVGYAKEGDVNALTKALASAATSYLTQALPTLLGQAERTGEGKRMTTYTDKNSFLTGDVQYAIGKASARIPGLDYNQIPYIDAWGREELTGKFVARAANNFINPAFVSKVNESDMEKELERLYDETGENVFPQRADKYFKVDGERKDLTAKEYLTYATEKGRASYAIVGGMTASELYEGMSDAEKAACVKDAYTYANETARTAVGGKITDSWVENALTGVNRGIAPETYIMLRNMTGDIEGIKDKNGNTISNSKGLQIMQAVYAIPGLNDSQRQYLFECFGVGKKVIGLNKSAVDEKLKGMRKQSKK